MPDLDQQYPGLSQLVASVLDIGLEELADRAPAENYEYFDLERLLAEARDRAHMDSVNLLTPFAEQVRGYLATIEAYVELGVIKDPVQFITKKLAAPKVPRPTPVSAEMLDTLAECSWGLWLHDQYGNVEEERPLPGDVGNADFYVVTPNGPVWVDCISVAPTSDRPDVTAYLAKVVNDKWRRKFGAREAARTLSTAVAVTLLKKQEHLLHKLSYDKATGTQWLPPDSLWFDCPGLQHAWFGVPPWHENAHRPDIFATWRRPRPGGS